MIKVRIAFTENTADGFRPNKFIAVYLFGLKIFERSEVVTQKSNHSIDFNWKGFEKYYKIKDSDPAQ